MYNVRLVCIVIINRWSKRAKTVGRTLQSQCFRPKIHDAHFQNIHTVYIVVQWGGQTFFSPGTMKNVYFIFLFRDRMSEEKVI